ncbi:MAG: CARDB domain-containing protein [Planctomycetia bacterium]|nr:CARDB domain-containing protein [Planctomycetia bacterium]
MKFTKRGIFILLFSLCFICPNMTVAESAQKQKAPGGLFGIINEKFSKKEKEPVVREQEPLVKRKPLFSSPFKKKSDSQKVVQEKSLAAVNLKNTEKDESRAEKVDSEVNLDYSEDFNRVPPISPSYGEVKTQKLFSEGKDEPEQDKIKDKPEIFVSETVEKNALVPSEVISEEARPEIFNVHKTEKEYKASLPQLKLANKEVFTESLGDPSRRLLAPTWNVLEKNRKVEILSENQNEKEFLETLLPPLPEDMTQIVSSQERIGAFVSPTEITTQETKNKEEPEESSELFNLDVPETVQNETQNNIQKGKKEEISLVSEQNMEYGRPVLEINTKGPSKIAVGTEALYEIEIENSGDISAENIIVSVKIPTWVEIVNISGSLGNFDMKKLPEQEMNQGEWLIENLAVNQQETLYLKIIPKMKRHFDMDVTWRSLQSSTQKSVIVEEPKLEVELSGESSVLLGKTESFTVTIKNVGNCIAEDINFFVFSDDNTEHKSKVIQKIGNLLPGESKKHTISYVPQQPGRTIFQTKVSTRSGTEKTASKLIDVRHSELKIKMNSVSVQYVGMKSEYKLYISNTGTSKAADTKIEMVFPENLEFISSEFPVIQREGKVIWEIGEIIPGQTQIITACFRPKNVGEAFLKVYAEAEYTRPVSETVSVMCNSLANMQIELDVPDMPMMLSQNGEYILKVTNVGSEAIQDAKIYYFFSEGLEPVTLTEPRAINGVLTYAEQTFMPGESRNFLVRAKGLKPGKHLVRVQVKSESKEIDLLEQKTVFYQ